MFSVRVVNADSYQATPLPQLDPTYSEFRGAEIKHVPVIRVFGTTPTGSKYNQLSMINYYFVVYIYLR